MMQKKSTRTLRSFPYAPFSPGPYNCSPFVLSLDNNALPLGLAACPIPNLNPNPNPRSTWIFARLRPCQEKAEALIEKLTCSATVGSTRLKSLGSANKGTRTCNGTCDVIRPSRAVQPAAAKQSPTERTNLPSALLRHFPSNNDSRLVLRGILRSGLKHKDKQNHKLKPEHVHVHVHQDSKTDIHERLSNRHSRRTSVPSEHPATFDPAPLHPTTSS